MVGPTAKASRHELDGVHDCSSQRKNAHFRKVSNCNPGFNLPLNKTVLSHILIEKSHQVTERLLFEIGFFNFLGVNNDNGAVFIISSSHIKISLSEKGLDFRLKGQRKDRFFPFPILPELLQAIFHVIFGSLQKPQEHGFWNIA